MPVKNVLEQVSRLRLALGKSHTSVGARPGTLAVPEGADPTQVRLSVYSEETLREEECDGLDRVEEALASGQSVWLDIQGLANQEIFERLAEVLDLHPLALEDLVNVPQRPSAQLYDNHLLVVTRSVRREAAPGELGLEQIALVIGEGYVVSVQERAGDHFEPVRVRLRVSPSRIRRYDVDYLAYALVDAVVDAYYPLLEEYGDRLEGLEEEVMARPTADVLGRINGLKKEMLFLRRALSPMREMLNSLVRDESDFVSEPVRLFLRDGYDHCVQLMDLVDTYREFVSNLTNTYLSAVGQRTNDVMKVLTIMASLFIPLTFLAGIYGMNFEYMPELSLRWGYPALLGVMGLVAVVLLGLFRRLGWLGGEKGEQD